MLQNDYEITSKVILRTERKKRRLSSQGGRRTHLLAIILVDSASFRSEKLANRINHNKKQKQSTFQILMEMTNNHLPYLPTKVQYEEPTKRQQG